MWRTSFSPELQVVRSCPPAPDTGGWRGSHPHQSILDFYRSANPNVAAEWWIDIAPTKACGLVLLLPDPPDVEAMSLEVASQLGAATARLPGLNHAWMAEAPERVAAVLREFWSSHI
jgi:hypothetical protein